MKKHMSRRTMLLAMLGCAAIAALSMNVHAAEPAPAKPLRIIAPFSPGSGVDAIARVFAQRLSQQMNVPVVVENRDGAGGMIGSAYAAKLPADGSSMLMATTPFVVGPTMQGSSLYDPIRDFTAIGRIAVNPLALTVNAKVPVRSMKELIDYARENPGTLTYASSGPGTPSQLEMERLKSQLKLDIREIPYRSNAQALTDVIAGTVSMYYTVQSTALGNVEAGQVRALAVAAPRHTTALPNVPTMAEAAGLPGYESMVWYGFVVPHGTPSPIVKRLNEEVVRAARSPEVVAGVQKLGFEASPSSSDEFARQMLAEARRAASVKEKSKGSAPVSQ